MVLNNHFDTDGALSVWTMVEPEAALKRRQLLIQAAEVRGIEASESRLSTTGVRSSIPLYLFLLPLE